MSTKVVEHNRALEWRPIRAIPGRPEQSDPVKQSGSWVLPGLWPEGVLLLAGRPKSGKTTLAIGAMVEIACGGEWNGEPVRKRRVAVVTEVPDQTQRGIQAYAQHMGREGDEAIEVYGPEQAWLPLNHHLDWWRGLLERVGPGGVVFLDTLMRVVRVADWNDAAQVQDALEPILEEARQRGVSLCMIHHVNKAPVWQNAPVGEASVLGSTYLAGAVDVLVLLQKRGRDGATLKVQGRSVPETDFRLRRVSLSSTHFLWEFGNGPNRKARPVGQQKDRAPEAREAREDAPHLTAREQRILEDLALHGPSTAREIAARTRIPDKAVRKALYALRDVGLVQEVGERPRSSYRGGRLEKVYCAAHNIPEPRRDILGSAGILASESTIPQNTPECPTIPHNAPIYTQGHSRGGILESADGDSLSNANITLKDVEIRRNLKDITSRYNELIQQRRNRADMSSISSESRVESSNFNPESIKSARIDDESSSDSRDLISISMDSARISMNFDHHRADKNAISMESARESNESAVDPDELIDYLLEFPYGMHEILPRFFPFLHRGDGLLEQGRQLAKIRPDVCRRVIRARALMGRVVQEWEQNRLELIDLAADLGLIAREDEDLWHPEALKALLAAAFLQDPGRMDRAERFLSEPPAPPAGPRKREPPPLDPAMDRESLTRRILKALTPGPKTDVALAEQLQVPRPDVQEALRIAVGRGQVAAFASDGVCYWARVPPGSPTEARESSHSDSESSSAAREFEQDSREMSSIPRDQSDEFAPISSNFDHDRADMDSISNDSSDLEEVEMGAKKRKKTARELSNSASIPRNSSHDGRAEMKERIMALARQRPITCSMVSNRLGIPHALAGELIGELLREGRLRVENTMLVPARPRF